MLLLLTDCCSLVTKSCLTLVTHGLQNTRLPVLHYLPEFAETHVHWVGDAIQHLIFCCPLLLLSSIFPSIRVFFSESVLSIRWPNYWSFSFSISSSNEYSGLISFRIDWEENLGYFFFIFLLFSPYFPSSPRSDWTLEDKMKFRLDFVSNPLRIIAMYMNLGISEHLAKCTSKINLKKQIL